MSKTYIKVIHVTWMARSGRHDTGVEERKSFAGHIGNAVIGVCGEEDDDTLGLYTKKLFCADSHCYSVSR